MWRLRLGPAFLQVHFKNLLLVLLLTQVNSQTQDNQEQATLLRLKQHWRNPPSISHWNLSSNSTAYCSWPEVTCSDGSVTGLFLVDRNITELIPPFICDLKNLTALDLQLNYIPGEFPKALYNCSNLEYLDLSQNYFVGVIPDDVGSLSRLRYLNLGANNFSGDIPLALGQLGDLRTLQLDQNLFNGSVPPEIGNLSELEVLGLAYNQQFQPSTLPLGFMQLRKLKVLYMTGSNLIGEIPDKIGEMEALERLDLSRNTLTGEIPRALFMLKNLIELYLFKNKLSGEIPQVIAASNLTVVDLSENNLIGRIPSDIGKLEGLSYLSLSYNQLSGEIPESIGHIPTLRDFHLFSNNLSGILPPNFGQYSMLEAFEVASNRFTGQLPEHLCSGGKLVGVAAFDNSLSGELPSSLGNCSSLRVFMIYNNQFTGKIPGGLWTALNLSTLMISENFLTGGLPNKVSQNLSRLDISNNRFSGEIPAEVSSWRNLVVFKASNNLLTGTIPSGITALPLLTTLSLDQNQLTGSIPTDIISWRSLTTLNLSQNQLLGEIPGEIGSLPRLLELDLSGNQLSDQIPSQLGLLRLTFLNLSSNRLTGKIPSQLENGVYSGSFLNNPGLCASTTYINLTKCNSPEKSSRNSAQINPALISVIVIAIVVLVLVFWLCIIRYYRKKKPAFKLKWKLTTYQRLNFTESTILSGLTENNLIGSGGSGKVYRVHVSHSGGFVAVKKIPSDGKLDQSLDKEFKAEVKILSTIRHLNIVKLMCCITSDTSKLLVYEYLENHSLDQWLHRNKRPSTISGTVHDVVLDWPKRLKIAVGAAQGLCYMHHECSPTIIHRDVKSSNILLDSQFNAKIADFGLAKILNNHQQARTMSAVAGSFGYMAPEYAQTLRVDEKIDVYSFGVILLELTTGREANFGDEHTSLAEWSWKQHLQEGFVIADALDEKIKKDSYLEEMSYVFRLGIFCTNKTPTSRPSMKQVLQVLLRYSSYTGKNAVGNDHDGAPLLEDFNHGRTADSDSDSLV